MIGGACVDGDCKNEAQRVEQALEEGHNLSNSLKVILLLIVKFGELRMITHQDGTKIGNGGMVRGATRQDGLMKMEVSGVGMLQTNGMMNLTGTTICGMNGTTLGKT